MNSDSARNWEIARAAVCKAKAIYPVVRQRSRSTKRHISVRGLLRRQALKCPSCGRALVEAKQAKTRAVVCPIHQQEIAKKAIKSDISKYIQPRSQSQAKALRARHVFHELDSVPASVRRRATERAGLTTRERQTIGILRMPRRQRVQIVRGLRQKALVVERSLRYYRSRSQG